MQQIEHYKEEIAAYEANTAEAAEAFRIKFLGTKGIVKAVMGEMKNVPNEQRKQFGLLLNEFKQFAEAKFETLKTATEAERGGAGHLIDWSLPGDIFPAGTRHPISMVRNKSISILQRIGFALA